MVLPRPFSRQPYYAWRVGRAARLRETVVEAIAQAGGALLLTEIPDREQKLMVFTGIERAKFRKPVTPGDQLRVEVDVLAWRTTAVRMQGNVFVDGKLACEAIVTCQLVSRPA